MTSEIRHGVLTLGGVPRMLCSADYPYYRDSPERWRDRLLAIRDELGIDIVSCYVPWRHHQPDGGAEPDFTGATDPTRDVVGFLRHCAELGIRAIVKPGPFIHGELTYGGLPDWVCPDADPAIEPLLDADGAASGWVDGPGRPGRPLPAPLGTTFAALTDRWLDAVGRAVIDGNTYPDGPVVAIQVANEGIYTNGARPLTAYDYSSSGLELFRQFLKDRYGSIEEYNRVRGGVVAAWDDIEPPRSLARAGEDGRWMQAYVDWGRFHAEYLATVYRRWRTAVGASVPALVNLNPPTVAELDDWLTRVQPRLWDGIGYGFTNWMGVVSSDPDAYARYVIAAKRTPGPNLEENWGFSTLYDAAYADATTSLHQSLLALAAGATGFNIYTAVGTSGWLSNVDSAHEAPYPDCAPVDAHGRATAKAPVVRSLASYLDRHGVEFLECVPVTAGAFGLYAPYAAVAAWSTDLDVPQCGQHLRAFHDRMRSEGHDYEIVDLQAITAGDLERVAHLTVPGGPFMHERVQRLLAERIRAGGAVRVIGTPPMLDEHWRPCRVLADALSTVEPAPGSRPALTVAGRADAYLRRHPDRDVAHLVVLAHSDVQGSITVTTDRGTATVTTARGGAAIMRLVDGRLDDVIVRGVNDYLDSAVAACVSWDGETASAATPGDLVRLSGRLPDEDRQMQPFS